MSHYEERLEADLEHIRGEVAAIGKGVDKALERALHALLAHRHTLAYETILGDLAINRRVRALDQRCHAFVARHFPSAGLLRFVSSVLRLNIALERIGDYAVTVCREAVQLSVEPPSGVARDLELVGDQARRILRQAMEAFVAGNADLARGTMGMAGQLRGTCAKVFEDLLREGEDGSRPIKDLFALLVIFNGLERVGDQAKNICEETVFAATGASKEPKIYRVLFIDENNHRLSLMAQALARKGFPESGRYQSAGWRPAAAADAEMLAFLDRHGVDGRELAPRLLEPTHEVLAPFHVIVALAEDARDHLPEIPFHTVFLQWDLAKSEQDLETCYKELAVRIRELMEALRGEGAA